MDAARPSAPDLSGALGALPRPDLRRALLWCWLPLALAIYLADLFMQTRHGLTNGAGRPLGDDFINYWSAAHLAWRGRAGEIYEWQAFHAFQEGVAGGALDFYHYSYPPALMVMTAPLAAVPYVPALFAWLLAGWYAFYRALKLALPQGALILSVAPPAVFINAVGGQNGTWTAALLGGGLCLLDRRPVVAGMLFGAMVYKPHLAMLVPVALAAGGHWRAFIAAGATAVGLALLSAALFGPELWADYARNAGLLRAAILEDGTDVWHRMVSVFVFARRLGLGVPVAYAAQAATALMAAALVWRAWSRRAPGGARSALLLLGTCFATPYLQDYDLVFGAFAAVWLLGTAGADPAEARRAALACALVLILPLLAAPLGKLTGLAFGPLLIAPAFALAAARTLRSRPALPERPRAALPDRPRP